MKQILFLTVCVTGAFLFSNCSTSGLSSQPSMAGPSVSARAQAIKAEQKGSHYIGRRYYVEKTRFWGYVRRPQEPWSKARLVILNEDRQKAPDRLPETGTGRSKYGFDANFEYKLYGSFTGEKGYDPNSNQILPEFKLSSYSVINEDPGWLFRPNDRYDSTRITLMP